MSDIISVAGVIATDPRHVVTSEGLRITSFRLASQQRRYDRAQARWIDAETNWFSVTAFRQLAENSQASLAKGDRVLVRGRLRIRDWTKGERTGITAEIEAEGLGHDLAWGRSEFRRSVRAAAEAPAEAGPDEAAVGADPDPEAAELEPRVAVPF